MKKSNKKRKRQLGTERTTRPLPTMHPRPSRRMVAFSRLSIVLTVVFWAVYVISVVIRQLFGLQDYGFTLEAFSYLLVVTGLTLSALCYLVARQGALQRFSKHSRIPRANLDSYFYNNKPSITVLIPSYAEETTTIRKTMLSAALQEFPNMRVVLLIDDDARKIRAKDKERYDVTCELGAQIQKTLDVPYRRFNGAYEKYKKYGRPTSKKAISELAGYYVEAADFLEGLAAGEEPGDHVDEFFCDQVLGTLAKDLRLVSKALDVSALGGHEKIITAERIEQLYCRLVWTFHVEISYFERKKYASLSHAPNKAMNLNSYIGLMGGSYKAESMPGGKLWLSSVDDRRSTADVVTVPDSDFLLTLDADSILLKEYCLRLVYFLQQPSNADVAVAQTPYSSFRGAPTRIERLAGATTDIQHIIHQGMSHYDATFWVGANAVIRKSALKDIEQIELIGGVEVKRYVQDNTVIEDTESSVDLAISGWRLANYPERLSYSATPPDFGSLVIQRRRWANGGLLILPKLHKLVKQRKSQGEPISRGEFFVRLNYMSSIAWSSFGLIFLLAYPYDGRLLSPFVLLAAAPYFISMAIDLKYCRYKYRDIFKIYGFNLILLPVNFAGTMKSIEQALTAQKTPFARTPKVKDRTVTSLMYVLFPLFIVAFSGFTLWRNIQGENWGNAIFAGFNGFAASWAIAAYIGVKNGFVDIVRGLVGLLFVDAKPKKSVKTNEDSAELDWRNALYYGEVNDSGQYDGVPVVD